MCADATANFKQARTTRQINVWVQVELQKFGLPKQTVLLVPGEGVDVTGFCHLQRRHQHLTDTVGEEVDNSIVLACQEIGLVGREVWLPATRITPCCRYNRLP